MEEFRSSSKFLGTDIDKSTGSRGGSRGSAGSMIAPITENSDSNEENIENIKVYDKNNFPFFNADPPPLRC